MLKVFSSRPSNIAVIKYMGKLDPSLNRPSNASLSYTLEELRSFVEIEPNHHHQEQDRWEELTGENLLPADLSETGKKRFLAHFQFLKKELGLSGSYIVRSANNFPGDCGLASSASSFAALTQATYELARLIGLDVERSDYELADLSRRGSGSSCRFFFSPWCLWSEHGVRPMEFAVPRLGHLAVVLSGEKKKVSSSEAHRRVLSSVNFPERSHRAEARLASLMSAMARDDQWEQIFEIIWSEFWDMHCLFETSQPSFGYLTGECVQLLNQLREEWHAKGDGPLITMDAGPNIHLLFRADQMEQITRLNHDLAKSFKTLLTLPPGVT